jgi:hypothetical protein
VLSDIEKVFLLKLLNQAGQTRGNYMARPNFGVQESALALDFSDSGKIGKIHCAENCNGNLDFFRKAWNSSDNKHTLEMEWLRWICHGTP